MAGEPGRDAGLDGLPDHAARPRRRDADGGAEQLRQRLHRRRRGRRPDLRPARQRHDPGRRLDRPPAGRRRVPHAGRGRPRGRADDPAVRRQRATDGDDYIEGGGGNDVIFGNLGQDDIVGGSSNLFSLTTPRRSARTAPTSSSAARARASGRNDFGRHDARPATRRRRRDPRRQRQHLPPRRRERAPYADVQLRQLLGGAADRPARGRAARLHAGRRRRTTRPRRPTAARPTRSTASPATTSSTARSASDVIYGDGQDDNIVGGYGYDWISGGTGDDGILGDDGRIFVSRISSSFGEPLYGIAATPAAQLDQVISNSSGAQQAIVNPEGALKYTADLTPDNLDPAGLATGGAAEPVLPAAARRRERHHLRRPRQRLDPRRRRRRRDLRAPRRRPSRTRTTTTRTANLLAGRPAQRLLPPVQPGQRPRLQPGHVGSALLDVRAVRPERRAAQDPAHAGHRRALHRRDRPEPADHGGVYHNWLLNFDYNEGPIDTQWIVGSTYAGVPTDGNDMIFGDLDNDWVVGGTGRDIGFLGWGDDLGNADDKLNTNNGLNDLDRHEPVVRGLRLRRRRPRRDDRQHRRRPPDRLVGRVQQLHGPVQPVRRADDEPPASPAASPTSSTRCRRARAPTRRSRAHGGTAARNGEPYGELGLLTQQDPQYGDQQGGSRDPQPGPAHDTRDVRISAGTQLIQAPGTTGQSSQPVVFVDCHRRHRRRAGPRPDRLHGLPHRQARRRRRRSRSRGAGPRRGTRTTPSRSAASAPRSPPTA